MAYGKDRKGQDLNVFCNDDLGVEGLLDSILKNERVYINRFKSSWSPMIPFLPSRIPSGTS